MRQNRAENNTKMLQIETFTIYGIAKMIHTRYSHTIYSVAKMIHTRYSHTIYSVAKMIHHKVDEGKSQNCKSELPTSDTNFRYQFRMSYLLQIPILIKIFDN